MKVSRKTRRRTGRPTKYSDKTTKSIASAISDGLTFGHAAAIGGISYETFCQWRKKYPEFSDAIETAKAEGIRARLKLILKAADKGDVSAARWWLEHVVPEHYGKRRIDHTHQIEGGLEHSLSVPQPLLDQIAAARSSDEQHSD